MTIEKTALTFDDVLLKPNYSDVLPRETDLSTKLTRNLSIRIPLLSAAMDTVTEYQLAIARATEAAARLNLLAASSSWFSFSTPKLARI